MPFTITERRKRYAPKDDDPPGHPLPRHTGIYDLRDPNGNVIGSTSKKFARLKQEADYLNALDNDPYFDS